MDSILKLELIFLFTSFLYGVVLFACYDIIRMFRIVLKHAFIFIALEDLLFWSLAGVFVFQMIYEKNDGSIRGFSMVALAAGMLLYYNLIGDHIVRVFAKIFYAIKRAVLKVIGIIFKPVKFVAKKQKKLTVKICKTIKKLLKNTKKKIIIAIRH